MMLLQKHSNLLALTYTKKIEQKAVAEEVICTCRLYKIFVFLIYCFLTLMKLSTNGDVFIWSCQSNMAIFIIES